MPIDPSSVMWSTPERERAGRPHLVLLHGYGSTEGDLFQLAPYLPLGMVIAAPRGPLPHPMGYGFSWFPLNDDVEGIGIDQAADDLAAWIAESVTGKASRVGILGFSQGGVLGLQVLRRHPAAADALVMLASARHPAEDAGDAAMAQRRPPVFSGRGTADEVIPAWRFADTADWLPRHARLTERIYEGLAHSVSDAELQDVVAFVTTNLGDRD
jgi:phospholipase/carboxylesterase